MGPERFCLIGRDNGQVTYDGRGFKILEDELKRLRGEERPAVIKAIEVAREHGDLSENAEYHAARDRQSFIEGRLAELEDMISRADVIDPKALSGKIVRFGATVKIGGRRHRRRVHLPDCGQP